MPSVYILNKSGDWGLRKNSKFQITIVLRLVRILRSIRILKLSRYSRGLRILGLTLYRSARVLTLLVLFQIVLAVTFGSFVYYMDLNEERRQIKTIPEGIWWAIITMTTVGYGDVVPVRINLTRRLNLCQKW